MQKLYYRHLTTNNRIPYEQVVRMSKTNKVIHVRVPLTHSFDPLDSMQSNTYSAYDIMLGKDWILEDWDYTNKFTFGELRNLEKLLGNNVDVLREPVHAKLRNMIEYEYEERLKTCENYFEMVKGETK